MEIDQYIKQLAVELEITQTLTPDEHSVYRIPLDDSLTVCARQLGASGGYYFFATLAPFPRLEAETILVDLMAGNLFGERTGEGAVALDRIGEQILYTCYHPHDLNYHGFYNQIENVANYADYWKKQIRKLQGLT